MPHKSHFSLETSTINIFTYLDIFSVDIDITQIMKRVRQGPRSVSVTIGPVCSDYAPLRQNLEINIRIIVVNVFQNLILKFKMAASTMVIEVSN